jgi:hypothetical protein
MDSGITESLVHVFCSHNELCPCTVCGRVVGAMRTAGDDVQAAAEFSGQVQLLLRRRNGISVSFDSVVGTDGRQLNTSKIVGFTVCDVCDNQLPCQNEKRATHDVSGFDAICASLVLCLRDPAAFKMASQRTGLQHSEITRKLWRTYKLANALINGGQEMSPE